MEKKKLRKWFEDETGIRAVNEYDEPGIDYMNWLEGKLIDALNPSSESSSTPSKCDKENCQMSYIQQIDNYYCHRCQVTGLSNRNNLLAWKRKKYFCATVDGYGICSKPTVIGFGLSPRLAIGR